MKYLLLILLLIPSLSEASIWYIRSDGNTYGTTSTTCNGSADVAYSAGNGPNCAVSDIYQIMSWNGGGTMRIAGGDTVYFSKASDSFKIGVNRSAVQSGCSTSFPYDCNLNALPDGTDSAHTTKIVGYGYDTGCSSATRVQLYGSQGVTSIFNTSNTDYVEYNCLDITDHSACGFRTGATQCSEAYPADIGDYGRYAFRGQNGTNQTYKYLDIHGLSLEAFNIAGISTIIFDHVNMDGNHYAGWDGDTTPFSGGSTDISGVTASYVNVRFNGCSEAYPRSGTFSNADYSDCTDQNQSGYGDGWGFKSLSGTFLIDHSFWGWNSSDGLDMLYTAANTVKIDKSRFEGNNGNQWKVLTTNWEMDNSVTVSNCDYLNLNSKTFGTFVNCRANGGPVIVPMLGGVYKWFNNTIVSATHSSGSAAIEGANTTSTCNGTETYTSSNNIFYSPNATWTLYYNGVVAGACATNWTNNFASDHILIYNFQSNPCPSGTGNLCATNPTFVATPSASADDNLTKVYIQVSSAAKGAGTAGNTFWNTSTDYNNYPQNSPVDMGALQYGSTPVGASTANKSIVGKYKILGRYNFSM